MLPTLTTMLPLICLYTLLKDLVGHLSDMGFVPLYEDEYYTGDGHAVGEVDKFEVSCVQLDKASLVFGYRSVPQ